jgi:23S rRNA (guanine2445-N2)-methyltransferase / 23S rRNA (guanine2069-N7)-methyltransferase
LLKFCGERLLPDGVIVFSNNFRRFKLDESGLSQFAVKEITASTIPFDFTRNPRIHRVWELRRE